MLPSGDVPWKVPDFYLLNAILLFNSSGETYSAVPTNERALSA